VIDHDETGAYKARAQRELEALKRIIEAEKKAKPKTWSVNASAGAEWHSNPSSETRMPAFRTGPTESAWKFSDSVGGSYEVFKSGPWTGKATYSYSGAFYTDSIANLNTHSNSWNAQLSYVHMLWGKPLIVQANQAITHTLLRVKHYSSSFLPSVTLIYSPVEWWRVIASEKWGYTTYDSDGSSPDHTSRDGYGNTVGITNYVYVTKKKDMYFSVNFEHVHDQTQGVNYRKDSFSGKTALHVPISDVYSGDLSFKFKDSQYPKFGFPATSPGRRDEEYTLSTTLTRKINSHLNLNGNYSYTNNYSEDDTYTYTNHAIGFTFSFSY
jgi:hypothetical protein